MYLLIKKSWNAYNCTSTKCAIFKPVLSVCVIYGLCSKRETNTKDEVGPKDVDNEQKIIYL